MESQNSITPKKQISLISIITLSIAIIALGLGVALLISSTAIKNDSIATSATIATLRGDNQSILSVIDTLKKQDADATTGMQKDISDLKDEVSKSAAPVAAPQFNISSFNLKYTDTYEDQEYAGAGAISTNEVKDAFIVELKKTLKSGGAPTTQKVEYLIVLVANGLGTFTTDDYLYNGSLDKPDYQFDIVGYAKMATINQTSD